MTCAPGTSVQRCTCHAAQAHASDAQRQVTRLKIVGVGLLLLAEHRELLLFVLEIELQAVDVPQRLCLGQAPRQHLQRPQR